METSARVTRDVITGKKDSVTSDQPAHDAGREVDASAALSGGSLWWPSAVPRLGGIQLLRSSQLG
jgi:hypothetical protein